MIENRMLRKMFVSGENNISQDWMKLHNEELMLYAPLQVLLR
jgi:hypothetical protein